MKKINLDAVRVCRGGIWFNVASYLRATYRDLSSLSSQYHYIGVRLVRGKR